MIAAAIMFVFFVLIPIAALVEMVRGQKKRHKLQILEARWEVIEASEAVIEAADEFCAGMPPELSDAIEQLRVALANEDAS
jgi:hypothetical protein